jgi:hypothetical protein
MQLLDAFQSQQSNTEGIKSSGDLAVAHPLRLRCFCLQLGDLDLKRRKAPIHTVDFLLQLIHKQIPHPGRCSQIQPEGAESWTTKAGFVESESKVISNLLRENPTLQGSHAGFDVSVVSHLWATQGR